MHAQSTKLIGSYHQNLSRKNKKTARCPNSGEKLGFYCYWCGDGPILDWQPGCANCGMYLTGRFSVSKERLPVMEKEGDSMSLSTGPLSQGNTAPTTSTCTSSEVHSTTTEQAGRNAAYCPTAQTRPQSLKVHTGDSVDSVSIASPSTGYHHSHSPDHKRQQSLNGADGTTVSKSRRSIDRGDIPLARSLIATHDAPSQTPQVSVFCAASGQPTSPSPRSPGRGHTASVTRPFSAPNHNIERIRSSVSTRIHKKSPVGSPLSPFKTQKRSTKPASAEDTPQPARRPKARKIGPGRFACPFRKKNPFLYRHDLCSHGFARICDVKQHLYRKHMTYICNRCGSEFMKEHNLTIHQKQEEACKFVPEEDRQDPGGITPTQKNQLHRRGDPKTDEREQWGIMWRIVFPHYAQLEPSPYVDDSEKIDAVFQFAHNNGLNIARAIPEMNTVSEAAIQTFILNIRHALISSGQVEDIPPPMDSPGSDDSPQAEALQEPALQDLGPARMKSQPLDDKDQSGLAEMYSITCPTEPGNEGMHEILLNMPLDGFHPNANGWYDFGQQQWNTPALQQHAAGTTPIQGQISALDYLAMPLLRHEQPDQENT